MSDYVLSLVRTLVPIGVGWLLVQLATRWGIVLDDATAAEVKSAAVAIVAAVYYAIARALEQRWPWVGILLGARKQPVYAVTGTPAGRP